MFPVSASFRTKQVWSKRSIMIHSFEHHAQLLHAQAFQQIAGRPASEEENKEVIA